MSTLTVDKVVDNANPGRLHLRVIILCTLLMIVDGYDMVSYGTVVNALMREWSLSPLQAGWLGSAALIGMLIGGLFLAPQADRWGRRPMLIGCLIGTTLFTAGCALAPGFLPLFLSRTAVGICLGAMVANFTALVGEFAPRRFRALMVCLVASSYSAGGIAAALVALQAIPAFGWRGVFWIGTASILLLPFLITLLPESPAYLSRRPERRAELDRVLRRLAPDVDPAAVSAATATRTDPAPTAPAEAPTRPSRPPVVELLRAGGTVSTVLIWVVFAMTMLLSYALNTWLPSLMTAAGYPLASGLMNLVMLNIGGIIGALVAGYLADRIGTRRVIMIWFVLASLSLASLALRPPGALLSVLLIIAGACTIGTLAIIHALAVEHYPAYVRSAGIGWAAGIGRIGAIGGPVLGGALLGLALPFQANFVVAAVPGLIGALAVALCVPDIGAPPRTPPTPVGPTGPRPRRPSPRCPWPRGEMPTRTKETRIELDEQRQLAGCGLRRGLAARRGRHHRHHRAGDR